MSFARRSAVYRQQRGTQYTVRLTPKQRRRLWQKGRRDDVAHTQGIPSSTWQDHHDT